MNDRYQAKLILALGLVTVMGASVRAVEDWRVVGGQTTVTFTPGVMRRHGLHVRLADPSRQERRASTIVTATFTIDPLSDLIVAGADGDVLALGGSIRHKGALTLTGPAGKRTLQDIRLFPDAMDRSLGWLVAYDGQQRRRAAGFSLRESTMANVPGSPMGSSRAALLLRDTYVVFDPPSGTLVITCDAVILSPDWAAALGCADLDGQAIGTAVVQARIERTESVADPAVPASPTDLGAVRAAPSEAGVAAQSVGPDIIVGSLPDMTSYGSLNGISAFAVGTTSCNAGDTEAMWMANTNQHPVIGQNMFRLKDNRFEQIGMSWIKHGFAALHGNICSFGCTPPLNGNSQHLGVGCSDPYSSFLNGTPEGLGPRAQVNAFTGFFIYPRDIPNPGCTGCGMLERRLQVHDADLDPLLNPGAEYFVEGCYVSADDALAGNGTNNVSYRPITISKGPGFGCSTLTSSEFCARLTGGTQREQPAIRAWRARDPSVVQTDVHVPGEGLFILAAKSIDLGNGFWRYEYAIENINSNCSGGAFSVPIPLGATVEAVGFHDVDYHSGELDYPSGLPMDLTDWSSTVTTQAVTWSTDSFAIKPNANALRWATLYSFWFRADVPPASSTVMLGLFKPGCPGSVSASSIGPAVGLIDCNGNMISDACDIDCTAPGCVYPCGGSLDCDSNGVPDECQNDCNANGIADPCDLMWGSSNDCDNNFVPDECQPDCDGDGIPDVCDVLDTDLDGIPDCVDLCPTTSPPNSCICPDVLGCCTFPNFQVICDQFTRSECLASGGTPECVASPCRDGCLMGDYDRDGDLDLGDVGHLIRCFSGPFTAPGFVSPSAECLLRFDFEPDGDVDIADYTEWNLAGLKGP